jgi:FixJ family two-component response regulator
METGMLIYIVDDRGIHGEYAEFLHAHKDSLPAFELEVFTHWQTLYEAILNKRPSAILADMRFDAIDRSELYGDIEGLANTDRFCGNTERAEAQIRSMQGMLICRALREHQITVPIILFASLAPAIQKNVTQTLQPIRIIEGLILHDVRDALREIVVFNP